MSLLQPDSPEEESVEELDEAAPGEDYAKGSSRVVLATVIATALVTIAIAIYMIAGQTPPIASGEIEHVWVHPQLTVTPALDANGEPMPQQSFNQVYVFALVKLHNQSKHPLTLHNIMTNATLNDGVHSSYAASAADYDRVFLAYPDMPAPHGKALPLETTIVPGQTVEGSFVSAFRLSKQEWDARRNLSFTFAFRYQQSLVLAPPPAAVTEQ
ncbi:MAG: hypothetical protein ABSC88_02740 [Terracidiphilus sp.]|jgi:hypothetical protein